MRRNVGLSAASDVSALLDEMFGATFVDCHGVLHVAAVMANLRVLRITPESPKSVYDDFVLSVSRARAHYLVTTGKILREEPELTHDYIGDTATRRALADWRSEMMGIVDPVHVLLLTSGRGVDRDHSIFRGPRPVTILTSKEGACTLRDRSFDASDVVVLDEPNIRSVIDFALRRSSSTTVSIEAGPSTAGALYESPIVINELLLSTFFGTVTPSLVGSSFVYSDDLGRMFRRESSYRIREADGEWSFARYLR